VSRFWGVFWIDLSTTDLAERSFLDVAQKLSIPAQTGEVARLGISNLMYPWLLVLDNADDPDVDYQHYFPGKTLGLVMLTSRNDECQQYTTTKSIALEGLCDREAQELLLKVARVPEDQYHIHGEDAKLVTVSFNLTHWRLSRQVRMCHVAIALWPIILVYTSDSASDC
jgi:hypothetical protein